MKKVANPTIAIKVIRIVRIMFAYNIYVVVIATVGYFIDLLFNDLRFFTTCTCSSAPARRQGGLSGRVDSDV